ncbi:WW/Rsp5/WWP [Penicillium italicum]|uniref:WW/Rsp5/WWP n=1 Tax=Penicillium italicum TaxID=40296 RepID=A0A0A2LN09_PENIT|nr:WW/Rsp5/WWP [Penicillium italicum]
MAPEAPADTAGPSSPPPQLPEGWLPQWEGVGRKWYYVQRTTGKSQWEIPTEPIVLTPSTTPTPMGAGPSQEPTSHPTSGSTREVESADTIAGGTYSAADSARISVGNRALMSARTIQLMGLPGYRVGIRIKRVNTCPADMSSNWLQTQPDMAREGVPMNLHLSTMPKPLFGSYSSNQKVEPSSGEFAHRASNASLVREGQPYQTSAEGFPNHSTDSMVDHGRFGQGQPDQGSHPQHALTDPALQGFSPLQHVQSQYQQQHMIRKQSGSHQANLAQGHHHYHNQTAQVGFNQYGSQHQFGHSGGPTGFSGTAHVHQIPYHQSSHYPEHVKHSPGETGRGSESHFVSGPWTSTPPSAGQL